MTETARVTHALRLLLPLPLVALLWACAQSSEDQVRAELSNWFELGETQYFRARRGCTVAVLDLARPGLPDLPAAADIAQAARFSREGQAFLFSIPGRSPDALSQALMTADLGPGLGMLTAGVTPAKDCISDDRVAAGTYAVLMSPRTRTILVPERNTLVLVHLPERLVFYLRGPL